LFCRKYISNGGIRILVVTFILVSYDDHYVIAYKKYSKDLPSHFIQLFFNENYGLSVFATNNRSFDNFYKNIDKRDFTYFN